MSGTLVPAESTEAQAREAFAVERRLKETARGIHTAWMHLAADLFTFSEQQMWRHLGYDNFDQWLCDPDVYIGRRWAFDLIAIWRELVIKAGLDPERLCEAPVSKLQIMLPAVRRKYVSPEEALADAQALGRDDLREKYTGAASESGPGGQRPDTSTRYDADAEPAYLRCPTCGQRCKEEDLR